MLYNKEIHKSCFCYKVGGEPIAKLLEFAYENTGTLNLFTQKILFVISDSIRITLENLNVSRKLKKGEFIFLPSATQVSYQASAHSAFLLIDINGESPECHVFKINKISDHMDNSQRGIHTLKANERMLHFITGLLATLKDGFLCNHYMQMEVGRMLFLLHAYYPPEECIKFFSHILSPDMKFSEFVRMNHMSYKTIGEMADALYMTPQQFANRFKKVFGSTPHKWMKQEKARLIYHDICRSDVPLKEIAIKYDFPLSSNFFRFCKQTFGDSPGNIRKSLRKNVIPR